MPYYKAFNLIIKSKNLNLPELFNTNYTDNPDILIKEESFNEPAFNKGKYDTNFLSMRKNELFLKVKDICSYHITNGNLIRWNKNNNKINSFDIRTFLLGSAIGALLIQRGLIVLHGNALVKDGKGIICLGSSGSGKSTLAHSLVNLGWDLISDDLVVINKEGKILPGIPRIKLWEDAALKFNLDIKKLQPVRSKLKKYIIPQKQNFSYQKEPHLFAIYLLDKKRHHNNPKEIINHRFKNEKYSFIGLRNQLYRPRFVKGMNQEDKLFLKLIQLQKSTPVVTLPVINGINEMESWLSINDLSTSLFWK